MATKDDLRHLSQKLSETYNFSSHILTESDRGLVHKLVASGSNAEVLRLELFDMMVAEGVIRPVLGMAFHVEVLNTDTIMIFSMARGISENVQLLNSYYQDATGRVWSGLPAYNKCENDKEEQTRTRTAQELKIEQIEEWQMLQLQRAGKLKVH